MRSRLAMSRLVIVQLRKGYLPLRVLTAYTTLAQLCQLIRRLCTRHAVVILLLPHRPLSERKGTRSGANAGYALGGGARPDHVRQDTLRRVFPAPLPLFWASLARAPFAERKGRLLLQPEDIRARRTFSRSQILRFPSS